MDDAPKPKVPARRNKQQKVEVKREPKQQKPRPKRAELEQVASGPFAMGPAKAGKKRGNYTGSESTSTISSGVGRIGIHSKDPVIIDSNVLPTIESSSEDEQVVVKREEQLFLLQFPMNLPLENQNELKSGKCGSWYKTKAGKVVVEIG